MKQIGIEYRSMMVCAIIGIAVFGTDGAWAQSPAPKQGAKPPATKTTPAITAVPSAAPAPVPVSGAPAGNILSGLTAGSEVVARAGDVTLTAQNVRAFVAGLSLREQEALAKNPTVLSNTVRTLLTSKLVLKEATDKNWDKKPNVAAQLAQARELALVEAYLRDQSLPDSGFPASADVERVYQSNQAAFKVPKQYRLAQIFVALPKDAPKDDESKATAKLAAIRDKFEHAGADFAAIAKEESDSPDAASNGGEIGWLAETLIRPEIRAQVSGLHPGEIGDPIKLDDGYHIIKLLDTKADSTRPLAEVHDDLAARLREEQVAAKRRAVLAKILEANPPKLNELSLAGILAKQAGGEKSAAR